MQLAMKQSMDFLLWWPSGQDDRKAVAVSSVVFNSFRSTVDKTNAESLN